jgi:NAD(P)-dependent dehydrogenase (short-subunit alcohol dehydrogenase family)
VVELEKVRREIEEGGGEAVVFATDLSEVAAPRSLVNAVVEALGGLDILINNAGFAVGRPISETTAEE